MGRGGIGDAGTREKKTYVDTGLDTGFGAGALENDVEATDVGIEGRESEDAVGNELCAVHVILEWELVLMRRFCGRRSEDGGGGVEGVVDEARLDGEFEASLVDIDADDMGGTLGAGVCAGEEADGASAENEDGRASGEGCSAGGVDDDAEGFCEGGLLVGDAGGEGVQPAIWVVHEGLEGAVEVGGCLRRGAKTHVGAEVVSALAASCAGVLVAGNAALDGDAGPDLEV
jgi:hypothetical protein